MPVTSPSIDCRVGLLAQHVADRRGDLALGEDPGRDLVEQRLEEVVVGPVDDRDLDIGAAQRLGGEEAAEAAADDHHAVSPGARRNAHSVTDRPRRRASPRIYTAAAVAVPAPQLLVEVVVLVLVFVKLVAVSLVKLVAVSLVKLVAVSLVKLVAVSLVKLVAVSLVKLVLVDSWQGSVASCSSRASTSVA